MSVCTLVHMAAPTPPLIARCILIRFLRAICSRQEEALRHDVPSAYWEPRIDAFVAREQDHGLVESWALRNFRFVEADENYPWDPSGHGPNSRLGHAANAGFDDRSGFHYPWGEWRSPRRQGQQKSARETVEERDRTHPHDPWQRFGQSWSDRSSVGSEDPSKRLNGGVNSLESAFLVLCNAAGRNTMRSFYRLIMREVHPDCGGDPETAKNVSVAWAEIERRWDRE